MKKNKKKLVEHAVKSVNKSRFPKFILSFRNIKFPIGIFHQIARHKKLIFISVPVILVVLIGAFCVWQWTKVSWFVQSSVADAKTYPYVTFFDANLGNLDKSQLDSKLVSLKSDFGSRKITLINGDKTWTFNYSDLGASFDTDVVSRSIMDLNKMSLDEKYNMLAGGSSYLPKTIVQYDNAQCTKSFSGITIDQVNPIDASVYSDQTIQIKADQPGTKFVVASNCQELSKWLASGLTKTNVYLDVIAANINTADLQSKLDQIKSLAEKPVTVNNGSYHLTESSTDLLALIDINKDESGIHVNWSSSRLDELVTKIANSVNTNNSAPSLGGCQYLISSGGHWLNSDITKKIFLNLNNDSPRSYDLQIDNYAASIGTRNRVAAGSSTIYLTYDDGMTYADRIMDYASCYGVKVTFFEIGARAESDATQLRRAIAEGHAVQSHGFEHALYDYGDRSYDWENNDMGHSISVIQGITGVRPTYFRPPGGNRSATTYSAAAANGLHLILWDDASRDATVGGLSSSTTCANVLAGAYPGASVLMHSTHYSTAEAMPCIVEGLAARGYTMAALR